MICPAAGPFHSFHAEGLKWIVLNALLDFRAMEAALLN